MRDVKGCASEWIDKELGSCMPCQQHKLTVFPSQLVPFKKGNTYIKHTIEAFPWPEAYASARIAHDM
jgi:hypothetical protein